MTKRLELPKFQAFDGNGDPLSGGLVYTYTAGTVVAKTTYSDYDASTPNANPVVLDSRGEADIYVQGAYKIVLKDSAGATIWTLDNVQGGVGADAIGENFYYPDADATDQGVTGSSNTIKYAVDTLSTDNGTIYLKHDSGSTTTTYTLTTSETIPANIRLKTEQGVRIDGAGTLTVNGPFIDPGLDQVFGTSITVVFGLESVKEVYPQWWGGVGDGTTDNYSAFTKAAAAAANVKVVRAVAGTYRCDTSLAWPNINLIGDSLNDTILDIRGSGPTFESSVFLNSVTIGPLTISHDNNANATVNAVDIQYGAIKCKFELRIEGNPGNTQHGFILRGENPDTSAANSSMYDNDIWVEAAGQGGEVTGNGIYLYGKTGGSKNVSFNKIEGKASDFSTCIKIEEGQGNNIIDFNFEESTVAGLHILNSAALSGHLTRAIGCWFDGTLSGDYVKLENEHDDAVHMLTMIACNGPMFDDTKMPTMNGTYDDEIMYSMFGTMTTKVDRNYVIEKTADYQVMWSEIGITFTNEGAGGTITFTLPEEPTTVGYVKGAQFRFVRIQGQTVRIDTGAVTDTIRGGGAGKYMSLDSNGAGVTLELTGSGNIWEVVTSYGTITYEA